ncbi:MAG: D-glycerate dehydrogenase [Planctomycetes bacterium]|nr:D-glycerate dehydrogenase [Planctomycetota bacterium]MCW8134634.1 D-glycerate dehydrogenase [Planctomycetota bacterium]
MTEPFVYITRAVPEAALTVLRNGLPGARIVVNSHDRNLSHTELLTAAQGCDALICTLADPIDDSLLRALALKLRVVAQYAVGVNNIALDTARELGIAVCNTPDVLTDATAEVAVGLMLACARRFVEGDVLTRQGRFSGWAPLFHLGHGVYGKTVGVVGAGRIGLRVARTMRDGFGCEVVYHARNRRPDWEQALGARFAAVDELVAQSDFITLHCPLTPQTRHLIDARRIGLMKPTAVLVNTARGPVVDEAALADALREGRIASAGLDVYEHEPAIHPQLVGLANVVLLPHIGSATHETRDEMGRMCARAVVAVLSGAKPMHQVV